MARTVVVTAMSDIRLWLVAVGMLGALMGELVSVDPANAQGAPPKHEVTVGLYLSPPFVTQDKRAYTGMAFDLWTALAQELSLKSNYRIFPTVPALQDAASTGDIDIAVTNLSITEDRALRVDFTYPWFDAGLRIMVRDQQGTGLREILGGLRDTGYLRAYLWIAVLLGLATILLTVFDRRFDPAFPARWRGGLRKASTPSCRSCRGDRQSAATCLAAGRAHHGSGLAGLRNCRGGVRYVIRDVGDRPLFRSPIKSTAFPIFPASR